MPRAFDWLDFFREHHISYVLAGPNIKRGEAGIKCPFCASADPSHHMGISLELGWWSCWRNRSMHSGKSPLRLIMKLLNVPYGRARQLAGLGDDYVDPEGFDAIAARLMGRNNEARPGQVERRYLEFDRDFVPITDKFKTRRAWNYLYATRGFNDHANDVDDLVHNYKLMTANSGMFQDRVIIPYYEDKKLVTWSARAIGESEMRYRDLPLKHCLLPPKKTLYNCDAILEGGKILCLVEGPMDVMKMDFYGKPYGVRAVGLSTNSISERQSFLLQPASETFDLVVTMLDNATRIAIADSFRMQADLFFLRNLKSKPIPFGKKDTGALLPQEVERWCVDQLSQLKN